MAIRSGQSITKLFTTRAFATGIATDATGTPTGTLYVNGVANAAAVTVTNITTGVYRAAVTLPALAVLDLVDLRIAATVSSVADNGIVWQDIVADTGTAVQITDISTKTDEIYDWTSVIGTPAGDSIADDIANIDLAAALAQHGVAVNFEGNVLPGGAAIIHQGADYNDTIGNTLTWTFTGLPTIPADAVIELTAEWGDTTFGPIAGTRISGTSITVPIDGDTTTAELLPAGQYAMQIWITSATWGAGVEVPYVDAPLTVKARI